MANRPNLLCELEKGKLVDTQAGFVDTFNFAVAAIDNLEGGKNCTVDWTLPDHPVINVELPESETGGGGGGIGVYDVVDDQGDGSRLRIEYNDEREDSYIDLSAGGGGGRVDDVSFVQRSAPNQYDRLSVMYTDGTSKTQYLPIDNAVSSITRQAGYGLGDVLSVKYTRSTAASTVPLYTTLSGTYGNNSIRNTAFRFTSARDSRVSVDVRENQIEIGVYYL